MQQLFSERRNVQVLVLHSRRKVWERMRRRRAWSAGDVLYWDALMWLPSVGR
jgi:hypothetical protein